MAVMSCLEETGVQVPTSVWIKLVMDNLLALAIVSSNLFILTAVALYRKQQTPVLLQSGKPSIFLIINLSTADLAVGLGFVYMYIPWYVCSVTEYLNSHFVPCILRFVLLNMAHFTSSLTLVAVAMDRYVAVLHGLHYADIVNTRRSVVCIATTWLLGMSLSLWVFYRGVVAEGHGCKVFVFPPTGNDVYVLIIYHSTVVVSMAAMYWRIHRAALTIHQKRGQSELTAVEMINTRSARTLLYIVIIYSVAWTPYMVGLLMVHLGHNVPHLAFEVATSTNKINYLANPYIYALNTRPIRFCLLKAVRFFKIKKSANASSSASPRE